MTADWLESYRMYTVNIAHRQKNNKIYRTSNEWKKNKTFIEINVCRPINQRGK